MLCQLATVDPDASLNRRQKSFMILGGKVNDLCLPAWLPPPTQEDDSSAEDASVGSAALSSSSDNSSFLDVEEQPTLGNLSVPETGCLRAAAFLILVVRVRNSILGSLPDWPVSQDDRPFSAPGQRPAG
jgi:hypothetical protein